MDTRGQTDDVTVQRREALERALAHIMRVLLEQYHPQKVILFGSMAAGEIQEWSDIDLVIVKETQQRFVSRLEEVALLCKSPVGVDYLVYTPQELEQMAAEKNAFILEEVLRKGKVLYERPPIPAMAGSR